MNANSQNYSPEFIDEHRSINVEYDTYWSECIIAGFKARMLAAHVTVEEFYWSGFWSQGDGACFTGRIDTTLEFLEACTTAEEYPILRQAFDMGAPHISWYHHGPYYHEETLRFTYHWQDFEDAMGHVYDVPQLQDCGVTIFEEQYNAELNAFESLIEETIKNFCRELYEDLEEEYYSQTSDEAVIATLEANEIYEEQEDDGDDGDAGGHEGTDGDTGVSLCDAHQGDEERRAAGVVAC